MEAKAKTDIHPLPNNSTSSSSSKNDLLSNNSISPSPLEKGPVEDYDCLAEENFKPSPPAFAREMEAKGKALPNNSSPPSENDPLSDNSMSPSPSEEAPVEDYDIYKGVFRRYSATFSSTSGKRHNSYYARRLDIKEIVYVIVKTPQSNDDANKEEKIHKEEAICRFCFDVFQEDNVLKTKCSCSFTLIHEECAIKRSEKNGNNKCDVCGENVQNIPVTLSNVPSSFTPSNDEGKRGKIRKAFGR